MRTLLVVLVFLLSIIVTAVPARATLDVKIGLDARLEYDDNINLTHDDEVDDFIATISPRVNMDWQTDRVELDAQVGFVLEEYLDNTSEDRVGAGESEQSSTVNALARLYRENLFLRVSDNYQRVPIDEGGVGGERNRSNNLSDTNTFQLNPYLLVEPIKNTRLQIGYTFEDLWYDEEEGDDAVSHTLYSSLSNDITPRISVNLNGSYLDYQPDKPDIVVTPGEGGSYEYFRESVGASITYRVTDFLTFSGGYGHSWIDYDVRTDADSEYWSAAVKYEPSAALSSGVNYVQDYEVSVEDGLLEAERASFYVKYEEKLILRLNLFATIKNYLEIYREDDSYGGELQGELPFNDKTGMTAMFRYTDFDRSGFLDEAFERYSTRTTFYYNTRLGRLSIGHVFNDNKSSILTRNYTNNVFFISASLVF